MLVDSATPIVSSSQPTPTSEIPFSRELLRALASRGPDVSSLTPFEGLIKDTEGRRYSLRIRPYITLDNIIDGATVVLLDIDSIKALLVGYD